MARCSYLQTSYLFVVQRARTDEEAGSSQKPQEKSTKPATCTVRVDNFVRPFTVSAAKELMAQYGALGDSGFWMNSIRTHCYATYKTVEQVSALATASC